MVARHALAFASAMTIAIVMVGGCTVHIGELVVPAQDSGGPIEIEAAVSTGVDGPRSSSYRATVMADGPIAYWRFGESSGTVALDESGHDNHARYTGNCAFGASGAIAFDTNTAVELDGVTAGISGLGSGFDPSGNEPFTVEGWLKPLAIEATPGAFFSRDWSSPSGRQNIGMTLGAPGLAFQRWVDGVVREIVTPVTAGASTTAGAFIHVAGTYDGSILALYKDGDLVGTAPDVRGASAADALFFAGGSDFRGVLDEVAIYAKALSADRVKAHFASGSRG